MGSLASGSFRLTFYFSQSCWDLTQALKVNVGKIECAKIYHACWLASAWLCILTVVHHIDLDLFWALHWSFVSFAFEQVFIQFCANLTGREFDWPFWLIDFQLNLFLVKFLHWEWIVSYFLLCPFPFLSEGGYHLSHSDGADCAWGGCFFLFSADFPGFSFYAGISVQHVRVYW